MRQPLLILASVALLSCDAGPAAKKDEWRPEKKGEELAVEVSDVEDFYGASGDSTGTGYVIEVSVDDDGGAEYSSDSDDGDDGDDGGEEAASDENDELPFHKKRPKFTGKAAKVEKQIVKEQIEHDVEQVQKLLEELDEDLAKR